MMEAIMMSGVASIGGGVGGMGGIEGGPPGDSSGTFPFTAGSCLDSVLSLAFPTLVEGGFGSATSSSPVCSFTCMNLGGGGGDLFMTFSSIVLGFCWCLCWL